ncbi:MAG: type II toxin-antitoxin system Phd/YefM family antitoxin [Spirochaetales bacterium]|nr:type II toxin-antitoxin system Phd/YefM family antitoxin [Spirochaetales bacterium]
MKTIPVAEVKSHLSSLLKEVESGHKIAISFGRKKETIAVIIPYSEYKKNQNRKLGSLKGKVKVSFSKDFIITDDELLTS